MTFEEVMKKLEELGTEQNRKIYTNHGCDIPMFGVSVANLKQILKPVKKDKDLGYKLLKSNNMDAIYLSQWIADPYRLTINDLEELIALTNYYMILDTVIPNLVIDNQELSFTILHTWIDDNNPRKRQSAYSLYAIILSKYDNNLLDMNDIKQKLKYIRNVIYQEANRDKSSINGFLIKSGI